MTKDFHPVHQCDDGIFNTVSGIRVDLNEPTPDMIDIRDIANSLSKICRFNGHVSHFYSVAQHSVLVCYLFAESEGGMFSLEALMHDAAEAYLGDVIKPLKVILRKTYGILEYHFDMAIAQKYDLERGGFVTVPIKKYDRMAVELEHEAFQKGNMTPLMETMERLGIYFGHANWDANLSRVLFLGCFAECNEKRLGRESQGLVSYITSKEILDNNVEDNRVGTTGKEGIYVDREFAFRHHQ